MALLLRGWVAVRCCPFGGYAQRRADPDLRAQREQRPADEEPGEPAALAQPPTHGVGVPDHLRGHLGDLLVARGNCAPGPPDHVVAAVCPHQETATAYRAGVACGQAAAGCRSPGRAVEAARRRAIRRRMCTVPGVA